MRPAERERPVFSPRLRRGVTRGGATSTGMETDPLAEPGAGWAPFSGLPIPHLNCGSPFRDTVTQRGDSPPRSTSG